MARAPFGLAGQRGDGLGQPGHVADRHEPAVDPVVDHLAAAADVGGHDRHPHRGGLHRRPREPLTVRGQHEQIHAGVEVLDVVALAEDRDAVGAGLIEGGLVDRVTLGGFARADQGPVEAGPGVPQPDRGVEHLGDALLGHQPPDHADHHVVARRAELAPRCGALALVEPIGIEALQIDAVAEQPHPLPRHAEAGQLGDVLGVLDQLAVRAGRGGALEQVDEPACGPRIARQGIEPVHGVDHHRHPGQAARRAARTIPAWGCGCAGCPGRGAAAARTARRRRRGRGGAPSTVWRGAAARAGSPPPRAER